MGKQENSNDDEDMFVTLSLDDDSAFSQSLKQLTRIISHCFRSMKTVRTMPRERSTSTAILKMKTAILPWTISPMMKNTRSSLTVLMNF